MFVAYNTVSDAPGWLRTLGATPLALGLDLRGGVYFLLQVDVDFAIRKRVQGIAGELETLLGGATANAEENAIVVEVADLAAAEKAIDGHCTSVSEFKSAGRDGIADAV